ncbi:putative inactive receptor kinase [Canna indica]|uniref:Inactive receptor kinase n=1 Tax=Canna indica TaxID=4628 RepID=A0AAQ3QFM2_9LILI|nr:putative inactive receptor kinase [Canna indica]
MASRHYSMGSLPLLRILLFFFFSFSLFGDGAPDDLASDRAALLAFRAAVSGVTRRWNASETSPCGWYGVSCSSNRVIELRLPGSYLLGRVPPGTLGNLTALVTLSLRYNLLTGTLPPDFASLAALRSLHLQNNRFSGEIPPVVFALRQLVRLNLGGNSFDGGVPMAFNNLTGLTMLLLDRNRLSGEIPLLRLPRLNQFNVSFNQLNGSIPASLSGLPASSFVRNSLCGRPLVPCPGELSLSPAPSPSRSSNNGLGGGGSKKLSAGAIAGIAIGAAVGFLIVLLLLVLCCRKRERGEAVPKAEGNLQPEAEMALRGKRDIADTAAGPPPVAAAPASVSGGGSGAGRKLVFTGKVQRIYDLENLLRASAEVLGRGTTGTTYKAMLEMGMVVAVKRLRDVILPEKEFHEKMDAIGAMDHPNLVTLQAYYYSKEEKLLVYEVVPNGSLSSTLHGNKMTSRTPLDWETRLGIALGAARGIEFIHLKGSGVSHGNIKSSNIILTKSYEARVSDFGLSSLGSVPMPNQRAAGYRAPEVTDVRKVSQKADVYSFGVLLMELVTGKPPTQAIHNEDGVDLPRWVLSVNREEWSSEVFDLELLRYQNDEEEMVQLLQLAIDCAAQFPDSRPSMSEVVARVEAICSSSCMRNQQQDSTDFNGAGAIIPNGD